MYAGREDLTPDNYLTEVAVETDKRTLQEAVDGADVFLGLSVSAEMLLDHLSAYCCLSSDTSAPSTIGSLMSCATCKQ